MNYSTRIKPITSHEKTQQTKALLKILAFGTKEIAAGKVIPARDAISAVRKRITR